MKNTRSIPACCLMASILFLAATAAAADDIVIADFKSNPLPADWDVQFFGWGPVGGGLNPPADWGKVVSAEPLAVQHFGIWPVK